MSAVLGLDAAWTDHQPSGVALLTRNGRGWSCVAVAPSYAAFIGLGEGRAVAWDTRAGGGLPDPTRLLATANYLLGRTRVRCIAVDMPLALRRITRRRVADNEVSKVFGGRQKCSTHSPTRERPGHLSIRVRDQFRERGFPLATVETASGTQGVLLEVYPHPAILTLCGLKERAQYKVSRRYAYWPGYTAEQRRSELLGVWRKIVNALSDRIAGVRNQLPDPKDRAIFPTMAALKRYEDATDALVSAWVGAGYLDRRARPYGDATAAIWIPTT